MTVLIGAHIGQVRGPSAICVTEIEQRPTNQGSEDHFIVRFLDQIPSGTPFPAIVERLAEVVEKVVIRASSPRLFINATGLGQPIIDLVESRVDDKARVFSVYFNHGDRRITDGPEIKLGKAYLVSLLQTLLQGGLLHLPKDQQCEALKTELCNFEIKVDEQANERYGAFRVGKKDELVTALGLAVKDVEITVGGAVWAPTDWY